MFVSFSMRQLSLPLIAWCAFGVCPCFFIRLLAGIGPLVISIRAINWIYGVAHSNSERCTRETFQFRIIKVIILLGWHFFRLAFDSVTEIKGGRAASTRRDSSSHISCVCSWCCVSFWLWRSFIGKPWSFWWCFMMGVYGGCGLWQK